MKAKITLDREEFKSFVNIVVALSRNIEVDATLESLQHKDALVGLGLRLMNKVVVSLKAKNRVTLTDMETTVVFYELSANVEVLPPYEAALSLRLLADIDKQRMAAASRYLSDEMFLLDR